MKEKIKDKRTIIIVLAVILTLSVGYAIFSNTLNINGTASTGSTNFNIVFDRVGVIREVEASNTTAEIKENGKKLEINVPGLSMPTAYAVIPVTIKNNGDITAKVKEIKVEGLDTTDIKVTYEGLAKEDIFNPNDEKEVNIKVVWDASSTSTSVESSFSIEIVYEQVASGSVTTTTPVVDSRFIYEGTKLISLSAEGEEYFKQPGNKELIIPEGTTEIADGAFLIPYGYEGEVPDFDVISNYLEDYLEKRLDDETNLIFESEMAKALAIETYNKDSSRLKNVSIKLPNTLNKIGVISFATIQFSGDLTIPNSVTDLALGAFAASFDTGLIAPEHTKGNLVLSNSLQRIGAACFYGTGFTGNLVIPGSLNEISYAAFFANGFNGNLTLNNGINTIKKLAFSLNDFTGDLIIPNSISNIENSAFAESGFTGILTLSENLTNISDSCFEGDNFTGELYIPDNITDIGYGAFWDCDNISSVSIPTSTTYKEAEDEFGHPSFSSNIQINKR